MVQSFENSGPRAPYLCRYGAFSLAGPEDSAALGQLLQSAPGHGAVRMLEARNPNFFAWNTPLGDCAALIARSPKAVPMLLYEIRDYPVYIEGKQSRAVCLRMLRSAEQYKSRVGIMEHGFLVLSGFLRHLGYPDAVYTALDQQDTATRRIVEAGLQRLPRFIHCGDMETFILSVDLGQKRLPLPEGYTLSPARPDSAQELSSLLAACNAGWSFAPSLSKTELEALLSARRDFSFSDIFILRYDGTAVGCIGVWDQRAFRQQQVQGYASPVGLLRPLRNLLADVRKAPLLPAPGSILESAFLSFFCLRPRHAEQAGPLVRQALLHAAGKGARVCTLGLSPRNPLMKKLPLSGYSQRLSIYKVHFPKSGEKPTPGGFTPQPELALL